MGERELNVYQSKLAEQAERYEDMVEWMKLVAKEDQEMSVEERNLLSVAYKNVIGSKRASWRIISTLEQKEEEKQKKKESDDEQKVDKDQLSLITEYKKKIEAELKETCEQVLTILSKVLEKATSSESKVFYFKMQGDYNRYLSEFVKGDELEQAALVSKSCYQDAQKKGLELEATNPIRLGLALNYSVFNYEILHNKEEACSTARQAFDDAIAKLDELPEENYKDSTLIMQLLRDNLTLWSQQQDDGTEVEDVEQQQCSHGNHA